MYGYLVRVTGSVVDAQDLLQMTNVTAWTRRDSFETGSDMVAWMRSIAINHCRNEFRRQQRRATVPLLDEGLTEIAEARHAVRQREDSDAIRREQLDRCVGELLPSQRALVNQFYRQSLSLQQIAEANDTNANAVGQRLHRIRSALLKCVQKQTPPKLPEDQTSLIS